MTEQVSSEYIIDNYRGRGPYILYGGLLQLAHDRGLREISTELLQVPGNDNGNVAIVRAVVGLLSDETDNEGIPILDRFSGIGDASPENVNRSIAPHLIRMAETRAKARALRDAVNPGAAVDETDIQPQDMDTGEAATPTQVERLRELAQNWYGDEGPPRLERRLGRSLENLTMDEADGWIDRLTR